MAEILEQWVFRLAHTLMKETSLTKRTLLLVWTFGINETQFESLNAQSRDTAVYFVNEPVGTDRKKLYMGTFEVTHQLHCLVSNRIRGTVSSVLHEERLSCLHHRYAGCLFLTLMKYNLFRASYRDYYEDERLDFAADPIQYHSRLDHCVDILRQKLEW